MQSKRSICRSIVSLRWFIFLNRTVSALFACSCMCLMVVQNDPDLFKCTPKYKNEGTISISVLS